MLKIITYKVIPFLPLGKKLSLTDKNGTEWLRTTINMLYNCNKERLRNADVLTNVFHNHDEKTSQNIIRYPLIIFHYINNVFYITGINEGKDALEALLGDLKPLTEVGREMYLKFKIHKEEQIEVTNLPEKKKYKIVDWLPLNHDAHQKYLELNLVGKITLLENQLKKHIVNDFSKYLNLGINNVEINFDDIDMMNRATLPYKGHDYMPFSPDFNANIDMPDFITLGNGKAFGFGRIENI